MPGRTRAVRPALQAWAGMAALLLAMPARMGWLDWMVSPPFVQACGGVLLVLLFTLALVVVATAVIGFFVAVLYAVVGAGEAAVNALAPGKRPAKAGEVVQDAQPAIALTKYDQGVNRQAR